MKFLNNKIRNILLLVGMSALVVTSCTKVPPVITSLKFSRLFTPTNLAVRIMNKTTAQLSWDNRPNVDSTELQFSKDSLQFDTIVQTLFVKTDTASVLLEGNTRYSVRAKAVGSGIANSKWTSLTFKTLPEQIFYPMLGSNISSKKATVTWPAGDAVTNLIVNPGNIKITLTSAEIASGQATITGLKPSTFYTVTIYNGATLRGTITFKTLIDLGNAIAVYPTDTLSVVIDTVHDGATLALFPGNYTLMSGSQIDVSKSITIIAVYPYNRPVIHQGFKIKTGANEVNIRNIIMNGDSTVEDAIEYNSDGATYGSLNLYGCKITNFSKSLISDDSKAFQTDTISVDSCFVSNIFDSGGDFMDSRASWWKNLIVTNSTFSNCATVNGRDFIRMDGGTKGNSYDNGTNTVNVQVTNCLLYNTMNHSGHTSRFFYVRWTTASQTLVSENNIIYNSTHSVYSDQSATAPAKYSNNDYYNADGYWDLTTALSFHSGSLVDNSSNYHKMDPQFKDPANNDFTITNSNLSYLKVGPPQWW